MVSSLWKLCLTKIQPGEILYEEILLFRGYLTIEQIIVQGFPKWVGSGAASHSRGAVAFWIRGGGKIS